MYSKGLGDVWMPFLNEENLMNGREEAFYSVLEKWDPSQWGEVGFY